MNWILLPIGRRKFRLIWELLRDHGTTGIIPSIASRHRLGVLDYGRPRRAVGEHRLKLTLEFRRYTANLGQLGAKLGHAFMHLLYLSRRKAMYQRVVFESHVQ
jgi:hypothetical protein